MKLSFERNFENLDGSPVIFDETTKEPLRIARFLADYLWKSTKGDPLKHTDWARQLYKEGWIDIDRSDFDYLKNYVSTMEVSRFVIAQLLECFVLTP